MAIYCSTCCPLRDHLQKTRHTRPPPTLPEARHPRHSDIRRIVTKDITTTRHPATRAETPGMNITIADLIEIAGLRATIRGNGKSATSGRDGIRSGMGMRSSSSHCPRPRCRRESRSGVHHRPAMSQAWIRRLTRRSHLCLCRREQGQGQRRMRRAVVSRNQGCTLAFHLRAWGLTSGTRQAGRRRNIGARTSTATSIRSAVRRPTRRASATADRSLITQLNNNKL